MHPSYRALFCRFSGYWRLSHWIRASRTGLYFGKGGGGVEGRVDSVLLPPSLCKECALNPRLPAKVKTALGVVVKPG